jgi:two-component system response regulator GlrR
MKRVMSAAGNWRTLAAPAEQAEERIDILNPEGVFEPRVRVGILCGDRTRSLADDVEHLLDGNDGFTSKVFEQAPDTGLASEKCELESFNADTFIVCLHGIKTREVTADFLQFRKQIGHRPIVVIPSELGNVEVFRCCQHESTDFLLPPVRREDLVPRLWLSAMAKRRDEETLARLKKRVGLERIIGQSTVLQKEIERLPRLAACDAPVLVTGESGTGKEVFARAIHYLGARSGSAFIPVNCGAIPEALVESELFGHKRGAFTGAIADHSGMIREADGGTLFLDEVDALTPATQVKLLRFLQEGEYRVVGSPEVAHADVRVIAASNADFDRLLCEGRLREDIFYRLNVLRLKLPPLRQRHGDIPLLARHFLEKHALLSGDHLKVLSSAALLRLHAWHWPGNVRELENVITRGHFLSEGLEIQPGDLELPEGIELANESFNAMKARVVCRFEREYLETLLGAHNGNITQASRAAGKNRRAFWELMRKHDLCNKSH